MYSEPGGVNALPKHRLKWRLLIVWLYMAYLSAPRPTQFTSYIVTAVPVKNNVLYSPATAVRSTPVPKGRDWRLYWLGNQQA